jgi:hypothetical protein
VPFSFSFYASGAGNASIVVFRADCVVGFHVCRLTADHEHVRPAG